MNKYAQKIQALKALANDSAASPAERQLALAKAAELALRHNIDQHAPTQTTGDITMWPLAINTASQAGKIRAAIAYRVAEAVGCAAVLRQTARGFMVLIAGAASELATARDIVPLILIQADAEAAHYMSTGSRRTAKARRDFLAGYGVEIADRITQQRKSIMDSPGAWALALALTSNAERATEWLRGQIPTQMTRDRQKVSAGTDAGRAAASRADIGEPKLTA